MFFYICYNVGRIWMVNEGGIVPGSCPILVQYICQLILILNSLPTRSGNKIVSGQVQGRFGLSKQGQSCSNELGNLRKKFMYPTHFPLRSNRVGWMCLVFYHNKWLHSGRIWARPNQSPRLLSIVLLFSLFLFLFIIFLLIHFKLLIYSNRI